MDTKERFLEYSRLFREDPARAQEFFDANRSDERFVAIVNLRTSLAAGYRDYLRERRIYE